MTRRDTIKDRLTLAFEPVSLEVIDESEMHVGHAGYQDGGESHFRVIIKAPQLEGTSRIQRHRAIHAAIGKDMMTQIHALSLDIEV